MKNEIKQIVHLKKQVAVGSVSLREPQYEIERAGNTWRLRIAQPDGTERVFPLSDRCNRLDLISTFIANASTEDASIETIPLCFQCNLDKDGRDILIRYLCEATDPVDTFPALTLRELDQFAHIESFIGGAYHSRFWESYGFKDANEAFIYTKDNLEIGIELEAKSAYELRELRLTVDSELLPFVYGALRNHLTDISEEREQISNRPEFDINQKRDHFYWVYQSMKERLTTEVIEAERTAILASGRGDWDKATVFGALYGGGAVHLTAELIATERDAILASGMADHAKATAVGALYGAGAAHLTAELISTERAAILASGMDDRAKASAVGLLYGAGAAHLTAERISTERDTILASGMVDRAKATFVRDLYRVGAAHLTAELISTERDAIRASEMNDIDKAICMVQGLRISRQS